MLDNVVYRLGFAMTRREARQLVGHGHFTVNGQRVDIPSYLVKAGDVIEVKESSRSSVKFKRLTGGDAPTVLVPKWLERDERAEGHRGADARPRGHRSARRGAPDRRAVLQVHCLYPRLLVSCIGCGPCARSREKEGNTW